MATSTVEKNLAAQNFYEHWKDRGYEKGDTSSFWLDLLRDVLGMQDATSRCLFEQRTNKGGFIDVIISDAKTIIEQKSGGGCHLISQKSAKVSL